jgi:hypothetical protein
MARSLLSPGRSELMMNESPQLTCLVLAPFRGGWSAVHEAVVATFSDLGIGTVWLGASFDVGGLIVESVQQAIVKADLIVADITGNNPNTLYELGFAHAHRKPVLIVSERGQELPPFDIRGYVVLQYDPSDRESLLRYMRVWAQRYTAVEVAAAS